MNQSNESLQNVYCFGKKKGVVCGIFIGVGGVLLGAFALAALARR